MTVSLALQHWGSQEVDEIPWVLDEEPERSLRQTAIVTQQHLHVFDLDASPPVCSIYPPILQPYKARVTVKGHTKTTAVKGAAFHRVLGKESLPLALLHSKLYSKSNTVVILKQGNMCHVCRPTAAGQASGLDSAQQSMLGLAFWPVEYIKPGPQPRPPGGKRGRPRSGQAGESPPALLSDPCLLAKVAAAG